MENLHVFLHGDLIGTLTLLPGSQVLFTFEEKYSHDQQKKIMSQSFFSSSREFIATPKFYRTRLPPFFSNLLPEGPLRKYLAEKGGVKPSHEFSLLSLLGEDLPGAIVIYPSNNKPSTSKKKLMKENKQERFSEEFHFSLAGVQLKFSALINRKGGLTIPTSGVGGDWIVKLPSATFEHVPENEYIMMKLARKIGINVPEIKLISLSDISHLPDLGIFKDKKALAVKRFDRLENNVRIHMEDFAQVYGVYPEDKYTRVSFTNIAEMIWTLVGEEGLTEFIRRLVFTIMIGNGDMHLKNWSFIYPDGFFPNLAPAYDLVSTIPYLPLDKLALTLVNTKNMLKCDETLLKNLCKKARLPTYLVLKTARETVQKTLEIWKAEKSHFELPREMIETVENHMLNVPLIKL